MKKLKPLSYIHTHTHTHNKKRERETSFPTWNTKVTSPSLTRLSLSLRTALWLLGREGDVAMYVSLTSHDWSWKEGERKRRKEGERRGERERERVRT